MTQRSIAHGSFTLERRYPAKPARVFRTSSDPVSKKQWFNGPEEWGPDQHEMDFRIGGRARGTSDLLDALGAYLSVKAAN